MQDLHHLRVDSRRAHKLHLRLVSIIRKKAGPGMRFDGGPVQRVGRTLDVFDDAAVNVVFSGAFHVWKWLFVDACVGRLVHGGCRHVAAACMKMLGWFSLRFPLSIETLPSTVGQ